MAGTDARQRAACRLRAGMSGNFAEEGYLKGLRDLSG